MDQHAAIAAISAAYARAPLFEGLFLGGSLGTGGGDPYSDIDLVAVADPPDPDAHPDLWLALLGTCFALVHHQKRGRSQVLVNVITDDWLRIDLFIEPPDAFARRARDGLRPVHDPGGRWSALPTTAAAPPATPPSEVEALVREFLRVLGLLHVVAGRAEYVTAVWGVQLQRDHLIALMRIEIGGSAAGALHLGRELPPADMATLTALPYPGPHRDDVIAAHTALARAFLPRAKALCAGRGVRWPQAFEDATRRLLLRTFGSDTVQGW
jgi:hypothetical protein